MTALTIRASSMDQLFACPPSLLTPQPEGGVTIKSSSPEARMGSAIHACMAAVALGGQPVLREVLDRFGVTESEGAEELLLTGMRMWDELRKYFPTPKVEVPLQAKIGEVTLTGTIDLLSPSGSDRAVFLDYKSGRIESGYVQQMNDYAWLIWQAMGRAQGISITGITAFLRGGWYRTSRWTDVDLAEWEIDLTRNVLGQRKDTYGPGTQCQWCARRYNCPALAQQQASTVAAALGGEGDPLHAALRKEIDALASITKESASQASGLVEQMLFRKALLEDLAEQISATLRAALERCGSVPLSGHRVLALSEIEIAKLLPAQAMRVLRSHLSDNELCECMTLSLPKVLQAYAVSRAGKRHVHKAELRAALTAAGAISTSTQQRMVVKAEENADATHQPGSDSPARNNPAGPRAPVEAGGDDRPVAGCASAPAPTE